LWDFSTTQDINQTQRDAQMFGGVCYLRNMSEEFAAYSQEVFVIVDALLAFLPLGFARQRPRIPWLSGCLPLLALPLFPNAGITG